MLSRSRVRGGDPADETVFRGPVRDQAELHGLLARIESLGLELVEVKQLEVARVPPADEAGLTGTAAPPASAHAPHACPHHRQETGRPH